MLQQFGRSDPARKRKSYAEAERERGADPEDTLSFISVTSPFYPTLESHYDQCAQAWYEEVMRPIWEERAREEQEDSRA